MAAEVEQLSTGAVPTTTTTTTTPAIPLSLFGSLSSSLSCARKEDNEQQVESLRSRELVSATAICAGRNVRVDFVRVLVMKLAHKEQETRMRRRKRQVKV